MNKGAVCRIIGKISKYILYSLTAILLGIAFCFFWIKYQYRQDIYNDIDKIPKNEVGLVLGTSKYIKAGKINPYYSERIRSAAKLYKAGKISYIIVSGTNPSRYYNEPRAMRKDLVKLGIPNDRIQEDGAGLRTLDSILRAQQIFGQSSYTIISQPFHNERALFLSHLHGQKTIAYNAKNPDTWHYRIRTEAREVAARVKAIIDIFILDKKAKYYGDPIRLNINPHVSAADGN